MPRRAGERSPSRCARTVSRCERESPHNTHSPFHHENELEEEREEEGGEGERQRGEVFTVFSVVKDALREGGVVKQGGGGASSAQYRVGSGNGVEGDGGEQAKRACWTGVAASTAVSMQGVPEERKEGRLVVVVMVVVTHQYGGSAPIATGASSSGIASATKESGGGCGISHGRRGSSCESMVCLLSFHW